MMHAIDPETLYGKHLLQGWSLSVFLHLGLVAAIALLMPNMTIVLEQEPFRWDVALVEPSAESPSQVSQEPAPPTPIVEPPPAPVHRTPAPAPLQQPTETVMPRVAPQQSAAMIHPEPPNVQPVQPAPPVPHIEPPPAKPVPPQDIKQAEIREPDPVPAEPVKQELVRQETVPQDVVKEPAREMPAIEPAAPSYAYRAPAPQATEPPPMPPREATAEPAPQASAPDAAPPSPAPAQLFQEPASPAPSAAAASAPAEAPPQVAKLAPQAQPPTAQTKADHRWVGESLWRRVAELKRYPASARLNGLEGRVVLKVVIRADGELAGVSVAKSSGHAVLDAAAMEAVKLACPLHMKQPIGPPQIVVSLPIVYSLAN